MVAYDGSMGKVRGGILKESTLTTISQIVAAGFNNKVNLLTEVVAYLQTSTLYLSGCIWHVVRPSVASCALTVLETAPAWTVGITRVLHTNQFRHSKAIACYN